MLQETDIIAEGRIKARNAPLAAKKEDDSKDVSAEAPGDTVAPVAEVPVTEAAPAPAAEAPKAEPAAAEGEPVLTFSSCVAYIMLLPSIVVCPRLVSASLPHPAICAFSYR